MRFGSFLVIGFLIFAAYGVKASTLTWTGAGSDDHFSRASNWTPRIVPIAGDDLVFPTVAGQYTVTYDLPSTVTLNSFTFEGNNYSFTGGGTVHSITVEAGSTDLGFGPWAIGGLFSIGSVYIGDGATLKAVVRVQRSNFDLDGPGTANFETVSNGGAIRKHGSGTTSISIGEDFTVLSSLTQDGGLLILSESLYRRFGDITVNSGILSTLQIDANNLAVRGRGSELKSFLITAQHIEISNGARYTPRCKGIIYTRSAPVLTGAVLNPPVTCDEPVGDLILNASADPVIGNFANFPEGSAFTANGRQFNVTYIAHRWHDVRIVPGPSMFFDFDGDQRADISVFRPPDATWYVQQGTGYSAFQWGRSDDKIVPADYDGDARTDVAVYRPSEGMWYIMQSLTSTLKAVHFGVSEDIPVPADLDGDGKSDLNVYRPSLGRWWSMHTSPYTTPISSFLFGLADDVPLPADYYGGGFSQPTVYRPSTGTWYFYLSPALQFGQPGDVPVPADYDGDGKIDAAVFRPSEGVWYEYLSSTRTPVAVSWGKQGDIPVASDYDGDGKADAAVFRPEDSMWWIHGSTGIILAQPFGSSDDKPVPAAYIR